MPPFPTTLILSTRNRHKVQEIRAVLTDTFRYLSLADLPEAPQVREDAETFAGNAAKKAVELARWLGARPQIIELSRRPAGTSAAWVLADDSGLEVDALKGAPGVHSARFAALDEGLPGNSADSANNAKLLRLLKDVPWERRTARFRCVIALAPVHSALPKASNRSRRREEADSAADRSVRLVTSAATNGPFMESESPTEFFEGICGGRIGFEPRGSGGFGYDPLFIPEGFDETFAELGEETKNQISHRGKALVKLRQRLLEEADSAY
ncbi:MAG: non-canonical purine NTP pyrophosphatase [Verrucomicrobia bacterium]|nr:non-canonical purine NTP pyrophosphatase [Verrucomicrobiota bacterium]